MLLKLVTAPAEEPVTLPEAKAHLRVLHTGEDALITRYLKAARLHIEAVTGRAIVTQTWDFWLPGFPATGKIELPRPPLQTVTWVRYLDADGAEQALVEDEDYRVVAPGMVGAVELAPGASWPSTEPGSQAVNVRFVAGYGDSLDGEHEDLRSALLLMTEHLYYNRGATTESGSLKATPMGVEALLGPYRTFGWGPEQVMNEVET